MTSDEIFNASVTATPLASRTPVVLAQRAAEANTKKRPKTGVANNIESRLLRQLSFFINSL